MALRFPSAILRAPGLQARSWKDVDEEFRFPILSQNRQLRRQFPQYDVCYPVGMRLRVKQAAAWATSAACVWLW